MDIELWPVLFLLAIGLSEHLPCGCQKRIYEPFDGSIGLLLRLVRKILAEVKNATYFLATVGHWQPSRRIDWPTRSTSPIKDHKSIVIIRRPDHAHAIVSRRFDGFEKFLQSHRTEYQRYGFRARFFLNDEVEFRKILTKFVNYFAQRQAVESHCGKATVPGRGHTWLWHVLRIDLIARAQIRCGE